MLGKENEKEESCLPPPLYGWLRATDMGRYLGVCILTSIKHRLFVLREVDELQGKSKNLYLYNSREM